MFLFYKETKGRKMNDKQFILNLKERKSIIIYGAGMVGDLVYSRLVSCGLKRCVVSFVQSYKSFDIHLGVPVHEISELIKYKDSADVIIATLPNLHTEISDILQQYGFKYIWKVSKELFQDMAANYIGEYRKNHKFAKEKVDILLMASDNNSSSGAFLCLVDLSAELNKWGISNVIVLPEYGNGEKVLLSKNLDFIYIPSKSWAKEISKSPYSLKNEEMDQEENHKAISEIEDFIVQHQVKLIHNNTSYTYVGAIAAKNLGIPFIWHIRENIYEQGFEFINYKKAIELINFSVKIIAVSDFISTCYCGLNPDKIRVCYDGVNVKDYYHKKKLLFKNNKMIIAQIGVITLTKNQMNLVDVAPVLKEMNIDFLIQFIGNGDKDYIDNLRKKIKFYHMEDKIIFMGRREDISKFYQEADIVAVCSRAESFGRTTVEAQLAGCLVIGAHAGATSELIEDGQTGFLYECDNIDDFAKKIIYAWNEKEISKKIAENGQKHAYSFYTKERNAQEIVKLYREILSGQVGNE